MQFAKKLVLTSLVPRNVWFSVARIHYFFCLWNTLEVYDPFACCLLQLYIFNHNLLSSHCTTVLLLTLFSCLLDRQVHFHSHMLTSASSYCIGSASCARHLCICRFWCIDFSDFLHKFMCWILQSFDSIVMVMCLSFGLIVQLRIVVQWVAFSVWIYQIMI